MKKAPKGWPRISPSIFYDDAARAIDWLCEAFGFEVRMKVTHEDGSIAHSQLVLDDGLIMVGTAGGAPKRPERAHCRSPRSLDGANTHGLAVFVDDVDAHCQRARAAGAEIAQEPETQDYGEDYWSDRGYEAVDLEGHHWFFLQRLREAKTDTGSEPQ